MIRLIINIALTIRYLTPLMFAASEVRGDET